MEEIKAIPTEYNGLYFRSRLEARWAVFFDVMGIEYQYEPEGFSLTYGMRYLPDFALYNVWWRGRDERLWHQQERIIYVEVKGANKYKDIKLDDRIRIEEFARYQPLIVLGNIPADSGHNCFSNDEMSSFIFLDGDFYPGFFTKSNLDGQLWFAGPDHWEYTFNAADRAISLARQARFEHGETPQV